MVLSDEINIINLVDLFMGLRKVKSMLLSRSSYVRTILKEHISNIEELINKITTKEKINDELSSFYRRYYFIYFNSLKDKFPDKDKRLFVEKIINFTVKYIVDAFNSSDSYYTMYVPQFNRGKVGETWYPFIGKNLLSGNEIEKLIFSIIWHFVDYYQKDKGLKIINFNRLLDPTLTFSVPEMFKVIEKTKYTKDGNEKPIKILLPSTIINFNLRDGDTFNELDIKEHEKDKETNPEYILYGEEFITKNESTIPVFVIIPDEETIKSMSTTNQELYNKKLKEFEKATIPVYGYDIKNKSYTN